MTRFVYVGLFVAWLAGVTGPVGAGILAPRPDAPSEQVVQIVARKFAFTPERVEVKKGIPVVLEISTRDVEHGFSIPDFNVRTAVEPGEVRRVRFTPDRAGTFDFLCDVYCGSGHEEMSGTLVVSE